MTPARSNAVFVTGGTGFIGAHAVRYWVERERPVVVLTRDARRLPRDLQHRVRVVEGNLENTGLPGGLSGCDVVVHCAKSDDPDPGQRSAIDLAGTKLLLNAAVDAGVRRFVYLSSIAAYGSTHDGPVDETFPRLSPTDAYGRSKLDLERHVLARTDAIEVVVLQPANVYGPGSCWWGQGLLDLMRQGKVMLINGGKGIANMVHVLDVVQALDKALEIPEISGECFLIADGRPILWQDYFRGLECILGRPATICLPAAKARELSRYLSDRSLWARSRRWLRRSLLSEPLIFPLSETAIETFSRKTVFSIAKARERLRYKPQYDLATGLETVANHDRARAGNFNVQAVAG